MKESIPLKILNTHPDELQHLFNTTPTQTQILQKLNVQPNSNNFRTLRKMCLTLSIDLTQHNINYKEYTSICIRRKKLSYNDIFTTNSNIPRIQVKKFILKHKLILYTCKECGNSGYHNKKPLSLQLEHINGINNDNRLENLCFLCPNCHSQTESYAGKKNRKIMMDIEKNINLVKTSTIDFSKNGWIKRLSIVLNLPPSKITKWMQTHMNDFYIEKCYKLRNLNKNIRPIDINNSQYGKCWIYHPVLKQTKPIKKEILSAHLTDGWILGRIMKW